MVDGVVVRDEAQARVAALMLMHPRLMPVAALAVSALGAVDGGDPQMLAARARRVPPIVAPMAANLMRAAADQRDQLLGKLGLCLLRDVDGDGAVIEETAIPAL